MKYYNLTAKEETDPIFSASPAKNLTNDDLTNLRNQSGTNTGDEPAKAEANFEGYGAELTAISAYDLTQKTRSFSTYNLTADVSGSATVVIKKCTYANFPSTLTTLATINLTSAVKASGNLSETITVNAGEYLFFELTSATTITKLKAVIL